MTTSPAVYSTAPNHLLAWQVHGEQLANESLTAWTVRMMADGAIRAMVQGVVAPYDLQTTYSGGTGYDFTDDTGKVRGITEIKVMSVGNAHTSDHTTAEMRDSLARAWQVAERSFTNTATACMPPEQAQLVIGGLIVPRPDDLALPDRNLYLPPRQLARAA